MRIWTGKKYIIVETSELKWVYVVYVKKKIIYIGCTEDPLKRMNTHLCSIFAKHLKGKIEVRIYGPYEKYKGFQLESELLQHFSIKKNLSNKIYGKTIKKSGTKAQELKGQSTVEGRLLNEQRMVVNY